MTGSLSLRHTKCRRTVVVSMLLVWLVAIHTTVAFQSLTITPKSLTSFALASSLATDTTDAVQKKVSTTSPLHKNAYLLDPFRPYECLRDSQLDDSRTGPFFASRPQEVVERCFKVSSTVWRAQRDYAATQNGTQLCQAVASLGPLAVKIGQTLSQRPDLIGNDAALALNALQTNNVPFDNALAYQVLRESVFGLDDATIDTSNSNTTMYIAPGIDDHDADDSSLHRRSYWLANMTTDPVACASLGQVYRGTLHDGTDVAVKVQRPDALALLALDAHCFRLLFRARRWWQQVRGTNRAESDQEAMLRQKQDVGAVLDRVAKDVFMELDYRVEAKNNEEFRQSLAFLGFVTTPDLVDDYSTQRVITTEWIRGRHLGDLDTKEQGLAMTRMAVEACTASLILTGLVHADPHAGNLMLHDDGRVVFLDFGLMSRVEMENMEGFAKGIQSLVSEDWTSLAQAFCDIGFVTQPIMHRSGLNDTWRVDPNYGLDELAVDLKYAMETTDGGTQRFGALATILNKKISPRWLVFTPPFILLLIRTFLTLEGIAQVVDPEFNIYKMSMPYALRRILMSDQVRSTLLTNDNQIQWVRLTNLLLEEGNRESESIEPTKERTALDHQTKVEQPVSDKKADDQQQDATMKNMVSSILGSVDGKTLRRTLKDLDSVDLVSKLSKTNEGRQLTQKAADLAANRLSQARMFRGRKIQKEELLTASPHHNLTTTTKATPSTTSQNSLTPETRPTSPESVQLQEKQQRWKKIVTGLLVQTHMKKVFRSLRGTLHTCRVAWRFVRMTISSLLKRWKGERGKPQE